NFHVTGVQTCALPISTEAAGVGRSAASPARSEVACPSRQASLTTTWAPDRSAAARTSSAAAPSTATTWSHPASCIIRTPLTTRRDRESVVYAEISVLV